MSQSDEFDLRELLGDPGEPSTFNGIEDTPASELIPFDVVEVVEKTHAQLYPTGCPARCEECCKRLELLTQAQRLQKYPGLVTNASERLAHPTPEPPVIEAELTQVGALMSPDLKDDSGSLDSEYYDTFNATITEVKDLEPEALQELRHRLDRMIRRAKIQQRAIRVTEEGKLSLVEEKRRKAIRAKDTEFMSKRAKQEAAGIAEPKEKKPRASKGEAGLSQVEKQVKQFVKLAMSDEVIRTTLAAVGTAIPENLSEMIARFRK